jgi:thiamine pyrophosphate-dependent acetolactate synthase large subunit-like protein
VSGAHGVDGHDPHSTGADVPGPGTWYASDLMLDALAGHGCTHLAFNPGATLRGLHDSIVHPAGRAPEPILALHEETAVAMAHGFVKMSGTPMAVGLHDTVGLLHASMALFNAWADRAPLIALVGTGPLDTAERRPWIDWVHTVTDQTALVRDHAVLTEQPLSPEGSVASIDRAWRRLHLDPSGPAVIAVDVALQERAVPTPGPRPEVRMQRTRVAPDPRSVDELVRLLEAATRPLLVVDRPLDEEAKRAVATLAGRVGAVVVDLNGGNIPHRHPHAANSGLDAALAVADLVVCLDVRDPGLALGTTDLETRRTGSGERGARLVAVGPGPLAGRAWMQPDSDVADHQVVGDVGLVLEAVLAAVPTAQREPDPAFDAARAKEPIEREVGAGRLHPRTVAQRLAEHLRPTDWTLAAGNLGGWAPRELAPDRTYRSLGRSGGEGLGYAAGATIGAALAVRGTGHVVVGLQGDGDLLYTPQALWSAVHHDVPVLFILDDNGTYYRDELHQVAVSRLRGRDPSQVGPGLHLDGPEVDHVGLARSFGMTAEGPIGALDDLDRALARAVAAVRAGEPVLLDVRTGRP